MHSLSASFSLLIGLGIAAGAFGAHALSDVLAPDRLAIYHTAVDYQLLNALGGLILSLFLTQGYLPTRSGKALCLTLLGGTLIFSGSLYLLVLMDWRWMGAITPLGGSALIISWLWAGGCFLKKSSKS